MSTSRILPSLYRNPASKRWAADRTTSPVNSITVGSDHHMIWFVRYGSVRVLNPLGHLPEPSRSFTGRRSSAPLLRMLCRLRSPLHPLLAAPPKRAGIADTSEPAAHWHDGELALATGPWCGSLPATA